MRLVVLFLIAWAAPLLGGDNDPFVQMSFSKALKKAKEERKLVFVDFYTTWCGPCKMLDKYTWPDKRVQKWLQENTVAMKIDAERQRGLARKYQVRSYPSLVFIDTDGRMVHTINGYRQPRDFLNDSEWFSRDPFMRLKLAQEMEKQGEHKRALSAYLWCLDYGVEINPDFAEAREALLASLEEKAKVKKSVKKALKARGLGAP
jgi:thioredoxin-related protein